MSDITDRSIIDFMTIENRTMVLVILDTLPWEYVTRNAHAQAMLGKVNDYLDFVHSGQIYEHLNKDDFVFNAGKVNAPMYRIWESCVGLFMQDVGEEYVYLDYDMLPENIDIDKLTEKAFENLSRDIDYRMEESKEKGIFGLLAGGNFEAESLCFGGIM